ncbi:LysE/ArgO family amino acid transporter [Brachybacterium alimentarium]|uniref:Amino acid transporter n=1 Tax=Brachybacterium alimentarium TaxID=47845 RepID=A0A2A3YMY6_9MICO|nr:LysE/ArgO family amino acid transporter [Brachybacterium alimentarium]PCC40680.1 amino acid transporter [Brachybacterium alimentarium]RCS79274.1 amino acid transporter [Brachybacterium alimentarium]
MNGSSVDPVTTALHGLLAGLSLIIAIGSQNVFVLRQGIRRDHVLAVVTVCIASDAVLILAGAGGLGALVRAVPEVVVAARWAGVVFLLGYAVLAARRALRGGESLEADEAGRGSGLGPVVATALALTWLNPHVYLDTVLLLGSIAATHGAQAWLFAVGAVAGSMIWFSALGFGARGLGRVLSSARSWRVVDGAVALTMLIVAGLLAVG